MFTKAEVKRRVLELRAAGEELEAGYNLACFISDCALIRKKDKSGVDYAHHTEAVANYNTKSETKMIIGRLHDVIEDSDWTIEDLRDIGFSERILAGLNDLTKRDGELYFDFIERCALNPDALDIKLKDLNHNLDGSRNVSLPTAKDIERIKRYTIAYNYLTDIKRGIIQPNTRIAQWMKVQRPKLQDWGLLAKHATTAPGGQQGLTPKP